VQRSLRLALIPAALLAACTLGLHAAGAISVGDAELQIQLANLLIEETRYPEALDAFDRPPMPTTRGWRCRRARARSRRRCGWASSGWPKRKANRWRTTRHETPTPCRCTAMPSGQPASLTNPISCIATPWRWRPTRPVARFGRARSLATQNRLDEALNEALTAVAAAPRDGEIHHMIGSIYERLNKFDEAPTPTRISSTCCPTRTAATRRPGRGRR
jgi:hypothetical protein